MGHENSGWMNSDQKEATRWAALFPIMGNSVGQRRGYMPMAIMKEHESQALRNHDQSIDKLKSRGGLSPSEALAVIRDKKYYEIWYIDATKPDEDSVWGVLQQYSKDRFPDFDPVTGN